MYIYKNNQRFVYIIFIPAVVKRKYAKESQQLNQCTYCSTKKVVWERGITIAKNYMIGAEYIPVWPYRLLKNITNNVIRIEFPANW